MIFGQTREMQEAKLQKKISDQIFGVRKFAWKITQIQDGRRVWLGFYYEYHIGRRRNNSTYEIYNNTPRRYLDHNPGRVEIMDSHYENMEYEKVKNLFDNWKGL